MKLLLLNSIVDGKLNGEYKDKNVGKICIDSRTLKKGEVFLAFNGKKLDGHKFIKKAIKKKPSCLIVSKPVNIKTKIPIIVVSDTNEAFFKLAKYYREQFNGVVIGITGSCGKTSTKEMLNYVLKDKYRVICNEKNYNNKIGVSLTLFNLKENTQILIVECGTNHFGEMKEIAELVKPDIVIITNIGTSHIGNFGSKRKILKEKLELINVMSEGVLFLNGDDKYLTKLKKKNIEVYKTYNRNSIIELKQICCMINNSVINFIYNNQEYELEIPVFSKGMLDNVLLVIECCLFLNFKIDEVISKLKNLKCITSRQQKISLKNDNILIDDSYNASYESVISLINNIRLYNQKKVIILGSMKELGKYSLTYHKKVAKKLKKIKNKELFLIGEETKIIKKINKDSIYFENLKDLKDYFMNNYYSHVLFVVKGANSNNLSELVTIIKKKY